MKLSKRAVEELEVKASDYFVWDDDLHGFGVRIWPSGQRTYVVQYRAGKRTRRVKIGHHGALTPAEARAEAKGILGDVARGQDPAEDRMTRRKSLTVKDLCQRYLEAAESGLIMGKGGRAKKDSTLYVDRGRVEHHILPLLGNKLVRDLVPADINRFLRDLIAGKTATVVKTKKLRGKSIVEGGAGTAARTVGLLGGILTFAVSEGIIPVNPARGVKRPADNRRTRRLTADEYASLGQALAEAADNPVEPWQGVAAVRLLALTGCRLGEVQKLRWAEVDLPGQCLRLEDSKEGASVRPIGNPVVAILEALPRFKGHPFVLPAVRGTGHYAGVPGFWKRLMVAAELEGITPHTLRHSFGSEANDLGFTEPTVAAMLGHSTGSVTGRYIHHLDAVLVAAADRVAARIAGALKGKQL